MGRVVQSFCHLRAEIGGNPPSQTGDGDVGQATGRLDIGLASLEMTAESLGVREATVLFRLTLLLPE